MELQEIFDKVTTHLLTQNKKAKEGIRCKYRNSEGLMCAAGCLIPNDVYEVDMEGKSISSVIREYGVLAEMFSTREKVILLGNLQHIHDDVDVEAWPRKLRELAVNEGLKTYKLPEEN